MARYSAAMKSTANSAELGFMKMHGLGNDFVVVDQRQGGVTLTPDIARAIGDRHRGVGFDQLAVIKPVEGAAARLIFYNADGSIAGACGNATRCIARYLMDQSGQTALTLMTERGALLCEDAGGGLTRVNMGAPLLEWHEVPLAHAMDTLELSIEGGPTATGMGNPHCSFFVPDLSVVDLASFGAAHEHHPFFPERTNVQVAQLVGPDHLRMRVWERGAGITLASGSSSCAVAVAAARRGLTGRSVRIDLDGGTLTVEWRDDGVWMTGPTCHVFDGTFTHTFQEGF